MGRGKARASPGDIWFRASVIMFMAARDVSEDEIPFGVDPQKLELAPQDRSRLMALATEIEERKLGCHVEIENRTPTNQSKTPRNSYHAKLSQ